MMTSTDRAPAVPWRRAFLAILLVAVGLASGCAESKRSIRIELDSALGVPAEIDEIEVWFIASRTEEGNFCGTWRRRFDLVRAEDLPLTITFETKGEYDVWAAFQIVASRRGEQVYRYKNRTTWPASGSLDVSVTIDPDCYRRDCGPTGQCFSGDCRDLPFVEDYFGDHSLWDLGVPCDIAAGLEDVAGADGG